MQLLQPPAAAMEPSTAGRRRWWPIVGVVVLPTSLRQGWWRGGSYPSPPPTSSSLPFRGKAAPENKKTVKVAMPMPTAGGKLGCLSSHGRRGWLCCPNFAAASLSPRRFTPRETHVTQAKLIAKPKPRTEAKQVECGEENPGTITFMAVCVRAAKLARQTSSCQDVIETAASSAVLASTTLAATVRFDRPNLYKHNSCK